MNLCLKGGLPILQCVQQMVYDFKNVYNVTLPMNNEDYGVIDGTFNEKKETLLIKFKITEALVVIK